MRTPSTFKTPDWDMAEKLGSVLHDKHSDRWYVQFIVHWPGQAHRKRHRIMATCEREAEKILKRIQASVAHGAKLHTALAPYVGDKSKDAFLVRWREFCQEKREDVKASVLAESRVKELEAYERRGYLTLLNALPLHTIDKRTLTAWIRHMRKRERRLSEKTIKNALYDIGHFLNWLAEQGDIIEAPAVPADELKLVEYQPSIPDAETVALVLAAIPVEDRGIFIARSRMGYRPSEARRLNVADVKPGKRADLLDACIALPPRSSKKRRGRTLGIHPELAAWLVKHGKLNKRFGAEPLFLNSRSREKEKRWNTYSERYALEKAYNEAGVDWIKPNECGRHFCGTQAVNAGADIYFVQQWLGHTDIKTTERYAKLRALPAARLLPG